MDAEKQTSAGDGNPVAIIFFWPVKVTCLYKQKVQADQMDEDACGGNEVHKGLSNCLTK